MSVLDMTTEIQIGDIYDVHFQYLYAPSVEEYDAYRERTSREAKRVSTIIENMLLEDYTVENIVKVLREHADYGKDLEIVDLSDNIRSPQHQNDMFLRIFVKMSTYDRNYASLLIEEK